MRTASCSGPKAGRGAAASGVPADAAIVLLVLDIDAFFQEA